MKGKEVVQSRDWVEPAHWLSIKFRDDLFAIYSHIKKEFQENLDEAFDRVSKQIGFVVTTTIPAILEVGDKGVVKQVSMGAEHLEGTLFDKELTKALTGMKESPIQFASAGTYNIYLLWYEALKLKFSTDWVEPAHYRATVDIARRKPFVRDWVEPAHWLDPSIFLGIDERVQISVIDEVYPELKIGARVASHRQAFRREIPPRVRELPGYRTIPPGVLEPAHFVPPYVVEPAHLVPPYVGEPVHTVPRYEREELHLVPSFAGEPVHYRPVREFPGWYRDFTRKEVWPDVQEPAQYRIRDYRIYPERYQDMARRPVWPEVEEPAQYLVRDYRMYPERYQEYARKEIWPDVQEPAQYRIRDYRMYPERYRDYARKEIWPEVEEPAQYLVRDYRMYPEMYRDIDRKVVWPDVQEPAQYRIRDYRLSPRRVRTY